ncbi:hypothetical protein V5O48_018060, partial [Marasmius crinis-equi]
DPHGHAFRAQKINGYCAGICTVAEALATGSSLLPEEHHLHATGQGLDHLHEVVLQTLSSTAPVGGDM